jgi:hypothetical protein
LKSAAYPSSLPVTIHEPSELSPIFREVARTSSTLDGSRQSSASGTGPLRVKAYDISSVTTLITPCFVRPALAVSATPRSA